MVCPTGAVTHFVLTTYRIASGGGRGRPVRLAQSSVARSAAPVTIRAIRAIRAPMVIDVSWRGRQRVWHQRLLVPFVAGRALTQPGQLDEAMCDGTSAQVLTPTFGGSTPLRVAVRGPGRLVVTVTGPGGTVVYRHLVAARGRTTVVSLGRARVTRGVYRITVAGRYSRLPQPIRLLTLAL